MVMGSGCLSLSPELPIASLSATGLLTMWILLGTTSPFSVFLSPLMGRATTALGIPTMSPFAAMAFVIARTTS